MGQQGSQEDTPQPKVKPTIEPTSKATVEPTTAATVRPTVKPSQPTAEPSVQPTTDPTKQWKQPEVMKPPKPNLATTTSKDVKVDIDLRKPIPAEGTSKGGLLANVSLRSWAIVTASIVVLALYARRRSRVRSAPRMFSDVPYTRRDD